MRAWLGGLAVAFGAVLVAGPAVADATAIAGEWVGAYVCPQGRTGVTLTFVAKGGGSPSFTGTFAFYALPENPGVPSGSFAIAGTLDPGDEYFWVSGQRWIQQPDFYEMASFSGTIAGDILTGTIDDDGCTAIKAVRQR